jgi:hypothetical protein
MHVVATCVSLGGTRGASIHRMPITAVVASSDASGGRSTVSRQPRLQHALDNEKPAPAMSYLLQLCVLHLANLRARRLISHCPESVPVVRRPKGSSADVGGVR